MDAFEVSSIDIHADGFHPDDFPRMDSQNSVAGSDQIVEYSFSAERKAQLAVFKETVEALVPLVEPTAASVSVKAEEKVRIKTFRQLQTETITTLRFSSGTLTMLSTYLDCCSQARQHLHTLLVDADLKSRGQNELREEFKAKGAKNGWETAVEDLADLDISEVTTALMKMAQKWNSLSESWYAESIKWQALGEEFADVTEKWRTIASTSKSVALLFGCVAGVAGILILAAPAVGLVVTSIASGCALVGALSSGFWTVSRVLRGQADKEHKKAMQAEKGFAIAGDSAESVAELLMEMHSVASNLHDRSLTTRKATREARKIADSCIMLLVRDYPKSSQLVAYLDSGTAAIKSSTVLEHSLAFERLSTEVDKFSEELRQMADALQQAKDIITQALRKGQGREPRATEEPRGESIGATEPGGASKDRE